MYVSDRLQGLKRTYMEGILRVPSEARLSYHSLQGLPTGYRGIRLESLEGTNDDNGRRDWPTG